MNLVSTPFAAKEKIILILGCTEASVHNQLSLEAREAQYAYLGNHTRKLML